MRRGCLKNQTASFVYNLNADYFVIIFKIISFRVFQAELQVLDPFP